METVDQVLQIDVPVIGEILELSTHLKKESPFYFGHDIVEKFPEKLNEYEFDKLFLITTDHILAIHGGRLLESLHNEKIAYEVIIIEDGEKQKSLYALDNLCFELISKRISKDSIIAAFGGGSVGNLVGMAAALIYRGVPFIEIPTTLMGQSDSTLSNKQAVNGHNGKNQLGTYYAPIYIWVDTFYLTTEPVRYIRSAMVEAVKNGLIFAPELLPHLEELMYTADEKFDAEKLHKMCLLSVKSKLPILQKDPTERKMGMILEYGHTFGHAIEWIAEGRRTHGEAVATGMCIAADLSNSLGYISDNDVKLHDHFLGTVLKMPCYVPKGITASMMISAIENDNKRVLGGVKYVLLEELGGCFEGKGDFQISVEKDQVVKAIEGRLHSMDPQAKFKGDEMISDDSKASNTTTFTIGNNNDGACFGKEAMKSIRKRNHEPKFRLNAKRDFKKLIRELENKYPDYAGQIAGYSIKQKDAIIIRSIIEEFKPRSILEIGSYCGVSTNWILSTLPDARIECIDPWLATGNFDPMEVFKAMTSFAKTRVILRRAFFGTNCDTVYTDSSKIDKAILSIEVLKRLYLSEYDLIFIDGDHRMTSSIMFFMLAKGHSNGIVYHDAELPQHQSAFNTILDEWGDTWQLHTFSPYDDGVAMFSRTKKDDMIRVAS
jgi:3-dehydroquinate synthetase/predicted O-methyltransferase YrrM